MPVAATLVLLESAPLAVMLNSAHTRLRRFSSFMRVEPYPIACGCTCLPFIDLPRTLCTVCDGSGMTTTTRNPHTAWEDWALGGQFDGRMTYSQVRAQRERGNFNLNTTKVPNIPEDVLKMVPLILDLWETPWDPAALVVTRDEAHVREVLSTRQHLLAALYAVHS